MEPSEKEEIDAIVAAVAADHDALPPEPESRLGLLPSQASNDNSELTWLRWFWLTIARALQGGKNE